MATKTIRLVDNSRFYILASTILISVLIAALLRVQVQADQLYYIRLQQVYGLACIVYWYLALIISPIGYVIGKTRMKHVEFSRRAIGVSAAYFALLHAGVALWGQLGGIGEVALLPTVFKWSLIGGLFSIVVLLAMAATSFDRVITFMTFTRWKWLHRLVYLGGIVAVLHVWSIGTHLSYSGVQITAFIALAILTGLETFRTVTLLSKKYADLRSKDVFYGLFALIWIFWISLIALMPILIQNYHTQHVDHPGSNTKMDHMDSRMNMNMQMSHEK